MTPWIEPIIHDESDSCIRLHIKAVPGASRDELAGLLGERLKIRTTAPPEGGRANKAICRLIAAMLGLKRSNVEIEAGATSPEKTLRIRGISAQRAAALLLGD